MCECGGVSERERGRVQVWAQGVSEWVRAQGVREIVRDNRLVLIDR